MPLPLTLARALAASRVVFGAGLIAAPRTAAAFWVGRRRAGRPEARALGRGLGGRDLAPRAATRGACAHDEPRVPRAALAAGAPRGGTALLAPGATRRQLPAAP